MGEAMQSFRRAMDAGKRFHLQSKCQTQSTQPKSRAERIVTQSDATSRVCPDCLAKYGKKVIRKRDYLRSMPLVWHEVDTDLPIKLPRVSSRKVWWNPGFVRFFTAPPDLVLGEDGLPDVSKIPANSFPWFECSCMVFCPRCGPAWTGKTYVRQFGIARLIILGITDKFSNWRKVIFSHQ